MSTYALKSVAFFSRTHKTKNQIKGKFTSEEREVLEIIASLQEDLDNLYNKFQFITDPWLIEGCIYEIKAAHAKYTYYIKRCKEKHITA
ncbi:MAG: YaaL family protein [Clostridiales bacterium]|jgi:hypothetical protein|nr:YaaL family protein [Clostridiales bacterium]